MVSVVMAVHNGERYVAEAVRSILDQTFADLELIVIEDGSTDATPAILASFDDSRLRIMVNPRNLGLTRSLNVGLKAARGELIARMDADDVAEPARLATQVAFLRDHPELVLCGTAYTRIDAEGNRISQATIDMRPSEAAWCLMVFPPVAHPSAMFRGDLVHRYGLFYDERLAATQDFDLWTRMVEYGGVGIIHKPLLRYRIHDGAVSAARRNEQIANHITIALGHIERLYPDLGSHRSLFERFLRLFLDPRRMTPDDIRACVATVRVLCDRFLATPRPEIDRRAVEQRAARVLVDVVLSRGEVRRQPFLAVYFTMSAWSFALPMLRFVVARVTNRFLGR